MIGELIEELEELVDNKSLYDNKTKKRIEQILKILEKNGMDFFTVNTILKERRKQKNEM